ncbi:uncharacterized [Tachysurus ichikawai]
MNRLHEVSVQVMCLKASHVWYEVDVWDRMLRVLRTFSVLLNDTTVFSLQLLINGSTTAGTAFHNPLQMCSK